MKKYSFGMATAMLVIVSLTSVNCVTYQKDAQIEATALWTGPQQAHSQEAYIVVESFALGSTAGSFLKIHVKTPDDSYDIFRGFVPLEFSDQAQAVNFTYAHSQRANGQIYHKNNTPLLQTWQRDGANILVVHYFLPATGSTEAPSYSLADGQTYVFEYLGQSQQLSHSPRTLTVANSQLEEWAANLKISKSALNNHIREYYLNLASTDHRADNHNWQQFIETYKN